MSLSLALFGATGRLGQEIVRAAHQAGDSFVALRASQESGWLGKDLGAHLGLGSLDVGVSSGGSIEGAQVCIDVSSPEGTLRALAECQARKIPLVIGTTGLSEEVFTAIEDASKEIAVLQSANMSVGVNLLARLVELVSKALGAGFDIEIIEAHHKKKKDSPSGTALLLGNAAAKGRGLSLLSAVKHGRQGLIGERPPNEIGMHAIRGGSVVGDHQVLFLGEGERISLGHMAESRAVFAQGALRAARWLVGKAPGRYTMADVLGV